MKTFRFKLILRVFLIVLSLLFSFHQYYTSGAVETAIIIFIVFLIQVALLINFLDRTNKDLSRFLFSIKYSDFSQTFRNDSLGSSFKELSDAFNEVIQKYRNTRSEKEENYRYLQTIVRHVGIGLISFNRKGKVELINNTAKRLLKIPYLNNLHMLNRVSDNLAEELLSLNSGDKKIIKVTTRDEIFQLMVYATSFRLKEQMFTLISLQNIQHELEEKEMDSWQKLIRVLTHEIMNSVAPIASLAEIVESMLLHHFSQNPPTDEDTIKDITNALSTIQKRSNGLINFVEKYRSIVKIPKPEFKVFKLELLLNRLENLMKNDFIKYNISYKFKITPANLKLNADAEQIEQVLINLLINAIHAVKESFNPVVEVIAFYDAYRKVNIIVRDNGPGINKEIQEKIFIPFFTTKQDGSGIGLSLSRQIIRAHGGTMRVISDEGESTSFLLKF